MEYSFEDRDEFKRKPVAEKLIKLLVSDVDLSPTIIDGPWGSGKTEFCKKLIKLAEAEEVEFQSLYLDTYKYDHSDDPFLMLITGISSLISDPESKKDIISKSIPVAKVLGKFIGKAGINWVFKESANVLVQELKDALDDGIKQTFEDFEKIDKNLDLLKESLREATKEKKIVIFIDELDRCKPTFALSLLEKVKHVFDIEGVQFVFTTNLSQLCAVVKQQYGSDIDAEDYLSKFFLFKVQLSDNHSPNNYDYHQNGYTHFDNLIKSLPEYQEVWRGRSSIKTLIEFLFMKDERSLRDAEKYFKHLEIFNTLDEEYSINENTIWGYIALMMVGVYIYTFDSSFSKKLLNDTYTESDISEFFQKNISILNTSSVYKAVDLVYAAFILDLPEENYIDIIDENKIKQLNSAAAEITSNGFSGERGDTIRIVKKTMRIMQFIN